MIPIEDAAGGATTVFHDQAEGTPNENANEVAHIEASTDEKKHLLADEIGVIKRGDHGKQSDPKEEYLICRTRGGDDVTAKRLIIDRLADGAESAAK